MVCKAHCSLAVMCMVNLVLLARLRPNTLPNTIR